VVKVRDVVLAPPRSVAGRVVDRQGRPVAGASVVACGDDAATVTDEMGAFRLAGLAPDHSLLVVRRDGFRINGRLLGPAAGDVKFVLARLDELPSGRMTTLPGVLPLEERRKLARRLLDPYLPRVLDQGSESSKSWALRSLMVFDPAAALEALEGEIFTQRSGFYQSFLRSEIAKVIARTDPEGAVAVAETIPEPYQRAKALVDIYTRMPDSQRARKRQLADRALTAARAEPDSKLKVWQLGEVAEILLDLGETEQAKAVFAEGLPIARQLDAMAIEFIGYFASRLTRVDLPAALDLLKVGKQQELPVRQLDNIAARVAASHPAEAERLIERIRASDQSHGSILRTCQNMAGADLARARRIATSRESAAYRALALVFTAGGLAPAQRPTARGIVRDALAELDRPGDSSWSLRAGTIAAIMPVVESIDPELVPEVFWRAVVQLGVRDDPRAVNAQDDVVRLALLLARYNRDVAAALYELAVRSSTAQVTEDGRMLPTDVLLLGMLDPRRAVAAVESLAQPASPKSRPKWSRIILSEQLGRDDTSMWEGSWMTSSGLGGVLRSRDIY
jgi:hypothetical protein